jgi:hypothetical protein
MAQQAVVTHGTPIKLACLAFGISQTCYRYQAKQSAENVTIVDWLVRLTHNQRNWGFGLCFLYLRNVKGYQIQLGFSKFSSSNKMIFSDLEVKTGFMDEDGDQPIHVAAIIGSVEGIKRSLASGARIDALNNCESQPIHRAASCGNLDVLNYLISDGADVNAMKLGQMQPIHLAAENGHVECIKTLLAVGTR